MGAGSFRIAGNLPTGCNELYVALAGSIFQYGKLRFPKPALLARVLLLNNDV
jgi:hypothetical protein